MDNDENKLQLRIPSENKLFDNDSESEETPQLLEQMVKRFVGSFVKSIEDSDDSEDIEKILEVENNEDIEEIKEYIEKVEQELDEVVIDLQENIEKEKMENPTRYFLVKMILQKMIKKICGFFFV